MEKRPEVIWDRGTVRKVEHFSYDFTVDTHGMPVDVTDRQIGVEKFVSEVRHHHGVRIKQEHCYADLLDEHEQVEPRTRYWIKQYRIRWRPQVNIAILIGGHFDQTFYQMTAFTPSPDITLSSPRMLGFGDLDADPHLLTDDLVVNHTYYFSGWHETLGVWVYRPDRPDPWRKSNT
jgi:hypothetical protein